MNEIHDDRILALYILTRQDMAGAVTDNQKLAIEQLKIYSLWGNQDAEAALNRLKNLPDMHPFLREVLAA